jgi:hypothetical protein
MTTRTSNETRRIVREVNKIIDANTKQKLDGAVFNTWIIPLTRMQDFAKKFGKLGYRVKVNNRMLANDSDIEIYWK